MLLIFKTHLCLLRLKWIFDGLHMNGKINDAEWRELPYTYSIRGSQSMRNSYFNQFIRIFKSVWFQLSISEVNRRLTLYHSSQFNEGVKLDLNSKYLHCWHGEKWSWGMFNNSKSNTYFVRYCITTFPWDTFKIQSTLLFWTKNLKGLVLEQS